MIVFAFLLVIQLPGEKPVETFLYRTHASCVNVRDKVILEAPSGSVGICRPERVNIPTKGLVNS